MKFLKIVAFVLVGVVALGALVVALAFLPSVQTWAVRKFASQPGMTVDVGRVAAGLSAADISDLRIVKDGMVITAKAVSARYSAWDYVSKQRINADLVTVHDAVVDLRQSPPASEPAPAARAGQAGTGSATRPPSAPSTPSATAKQSAPFQGVLGAAQLPFDLRVARLEARGRALLPGEQTVAFEIQGANLETGQRGRIDWKVDFADAKQDAAVRTLRSIGAANVHLAADRRIDSVEVEAEATATGPQLPPESVKLVARAEQPTPKGNEGYTATIGLLRPDNTVEPLVKTNAQFLVASREIAGAWEVNVRSEQLAALLGSLGLPRIAATGAGKYSVKPDTGAAAANGSLQADASQLEKLSPQLAAIGSIHLETMFDGAVADNIAHLAKLDLAVTARDGRKFAQISSLQKIAYHLGDKRVTLANPQAELARVSLQALPLAWAQAWARPLQIESGDLSLVLAVEAEPDGSRVRARAIEPLALRAVTVRDAARKPLVEKLNLTAKPSVDYSAAKISARLAELSLALPAGDALTGNLSAEVTDAATTPTIAFVAQLQAKVVDALKPYLPLDPGPLAIETSAQGRVRGDVLHVVKAAATVNRTAGGLLAALELQQPITANLQAKSFTFPHPTATAARVRLGEAPLAWAEAFVPKSKFAGALTGGTLEISARSFDDLTVNLSEPLALRGVSATLDGKPMAQALDATTELSATKKGDTVTYDVRRLVVKQGEAALASLAVAGATKLGAKVTGTAKGKLDADVAALMKQPALAPNATLARGRLTGAFEAEFGESVLAKASLSAKHLVAKQDNRALGDLELTLDANMKPDGTGTVKLPLTLANAQRKSDVLVQGAFGKTQKGDKFLFTGKIASERLFVDDFEPLAALAPATPTPGGTPPASPPQSRPGQPIIIRAPGSAPGAAPGAPAGRDTVPFWNAVNGKIEVDLKRIVYGKDYVISGVRGAAVITDSRLSLDGLAGRFRENPFKLSGGVTFAGSAPQPYGLMAAADVTDFDVGEFLRAANPGEKPALETKATIRANLNGHGGTFDDLLKNAFGRFELTGSKGVARYLARKGSAGTALNLATGVLGLVGAARGSDTTVAIAEIARLLNEVPFDSVRMQVERGADLTFKLTSMELLSPIVRMTGTGAVASKGTDDLAKAPMNITLQLGARDELAHLLGRVGLLEAAQTAQGVQAKLDEKGYAVMSRTFTIGGTTAKPDSSALWRILGEAALGALVR